MMDAAITHECRDLRLSHSDACDTRAIHALHASATGIRKPDTLCSSTCSAAQFSTHTYSLSVRSYVEVMQFQHTHIH